MLSRKNMAFTSPFYVACSEPLRNLLRQITSRWFSCVSRRTLYCINACVIYTFASVATVFLNRSLLSRRFPFPVTLCWIQGILGVVVYLSVSSYCRRSAIKRKYKNFFEQPYDEFQLLEQQQEGKGRLSRCQTGNCERLQQRQQLIQEALQVPQQERYRLLQNSQLAEAHMLHQVSHGIGDTVQQRQQGNSSSIYQYPAHQQEHHLQQHSQGRYEDLLTEITDKLSFLFPPVTLQWKNQRRVLPLSIAFLGMIALSNACLLHAQVSTYQVARALTLLFNLLLQHFLLGLHVSRGAAGSCGIVCLGFAVGSLDVKTLSTAGAITGAFSSIFQAAYTAQMRSVVHDLGGAQAACMLYNMLNSVFLLPPLIWVSGEANSLFRSANSGTIGAGDLETTSFSKGEALQAMFKGEAVDGELWQEPIETAVLAIASGIAGLALSLSTSWIVSIISPLSFSMLGYVKACAQTCLGFILLQERCSVQALAGVLLTICGSAFFVTVKHREAQAARFTVGKEEFCENGIGQVQSDGGNQLKVFSGAGSLEKMKDDRNGRR